MRVCADMTYLSLELSISVNCCLPLHRAAAALQLSVKPTL